jgi:uncharacterized protein YabE (DUF348 family)
VVKKKYSKLIVVLLLLILGVVFYKINSFKNKTYFGNFNSEKKNVTVVDDGTRYQLADVASSTVGELLKEKNILVSGNDHIFPAQDAKIYGGSTVVIEHSKALTILADGKKIDAKTLGTTVAMALWDTGIKLGDDDFTNPPIETPVQDKNKIEVVRVDITEDVVKKEVDFEKKSAEDDKLSWRIKKVSQKGVKGIDTYTYRVVSHNGKEITRRLLSKERTSDPTPEISVQGTYMKLGKSNSGQGTWYAFKGGLFAASTTIPRGAYVKVTNSANGKTVVVQINDYGPQGKGRIIDLDKVAFEKIADLGAGVVSVKVEQVLN